MKTQPRPSTRPSSGGCCGSSNHVVENAYSGMESGVAAAGKEVMYVTEQTQAAVLHTGISMI
jgi:hypothetical protein